MSQISTFLRYNIIIQQLRKKPSNFEEISTYLQKDYRLKDYRADISKRTFKRDLEDILELFGIEIQFNFSQKVYEIKTEKHSEIFVSVLRLLENFDLFQATKLSQQLSQQVISFEKRKAKGTQYLTKILHAISENIVLEVWHQKFDKDQSILREIQPLAIKESRGRWYLVAFLPKEEHIRTFGLDRITELFISEKTFKPITFDVNSYYEHCFGIIRPEPGTPEEVILAFTPQQAQYIKTYPLHHSQKMILENEKEVQFSVYVFITLDFVQEIRSFGKEVKVISHKNFDSYLS